MDLSQPSWFADLGSWWVPAVGPEVAGNVRPLGLDAHGALHVACSSRAWEEQVTLLKEPITVRLNAALGAHAVSSVLVDLRNG
ncbi:DUF721 domain-containing protein [Streptomyces sp. NPDC032472]|uniref:DUF721 domain-containing protein n=1 Tax=Streptomyces sp. NPDC032472 TaxID=3155018 RepID=UPI0033EDB408